MVAYTESEGTGNAMLRIWQSIIVLVKDERQTFDLPGKVCLALSKSLRVKAVLVYARKTERRSSGECGQQSRWSSKPFNHSRKKKCLGWRTAQSRLFLKIPGIKVNRAKYFYF